MFEQAFRNIDDVLRKEAGCTTELDYTEQTSWLLFLKYLDGLEQDKADEAKLKGKRYTFLLDKPYRWEAWAAPKGKDGKLPDFFKDEAELRKLWSDPSTRKALLEGLAEKGYGRTALVEIQRLIDAEKSALFDVLAALAFQLKPVTREQRAQNAKVEISTHFNSKQRVFLEFVLAQYVKEGVDELASEKLSPLLKLKYNNAIADAIADLGKPEEIGKVFADFQKYLYSEEVA